MLIRISVKTAAVSLGSLRMGRFGVYYYPSLGALLAVCRASQVHVPCVIRYPGTWYFLLKENRGRRFKLPVSISFFFADTRLVENCRVCRHSGFPVQGQVWGTISSRFGRVACRVPCVTHACAVRNAIVFFVKNNTGRRSELLGCNVEFEDASSSPGRRLFLFLIFSFFPTCL